MMEKATHVLIVDDSLDIQSLLAIFLKSEGYRISCANTGSEAMKFLNSGNGLPDVILLDLMMPEMDGYEFRHVQERDPKLSHIPIVIMTADNNVHGRDKKINGHAFLRKPFSDPDSILQTINQVLVQTKQTL